MPDMNKFVPVKCEIVAGQYFRVWLDSRNFETYLITPNRTWGDGVHPDSRKHIQAAVANPGDFDFAMSGSRAHEDFNDNNVLHIKPKTWGAKLKGALNA